MIAAMEALLPAEDERALMQVVQGGDEAAFTRLVERLAPRLWRHLVANGMSGADADDLVQETFLRVHRKRGSYDARWAPTTWIWTIARRLGANLARRRRPQPLPEDIPAAPPALSGTVWETARMLLDDRAYQVLWLRYGDSLEHEEIAELVDATPGNVRVILHRARLLLSQHLAPDGALRHV